MMSQLKVYSIFDSIDGEANAFGGAGEPSTFLRLAGCNLNCAYCDTKYALSLESGHSYNVDSLINTLVIKKKLTFTGGEPLYQGPPVVELITGLIRKNPEIRITVETNGSVNFGQYGLHLFPKKNLRFVMDVKMPSSGVEVPCVWDNFDILTEHDAVKFVCCDMDDVNFMFNNILRSTSSICPAKRYISPGIGEPGPFQLEWATQLAQMVGVQAKFVRAGLHFSLQIHKVLWPHVEDGR